MRRKRYVRCLTKQWLRVGTAKAYRTNGFVCVYATIVCVYVCVRVFVCACVFECVSVCLCVGVGGKGVRGR